MSTRDRFQVERLEDRMVLSGDALADWLTPVPDSVTWRGQTDLQWLTGSWVGPMEQVASLPPENEPHDAPLGIEPLRPLVLRWAESREEGLHVFCVRPALAAACEARLVLMLQGSPGAHWRPVVAMNGSLGDSIAGRLVESSRGLWAFEFDNFDPLQEYQITIDQRGLTAASRTQDFLLSLHLGTTWEKLQEGIRSHAVDLSDTPMLLVTQGNSFDLHMQTWSDSSVDNAQVRLSIVSADGSLAYQEETWVGSTMAEQVSLVEGQYYIFIDDYGASGALLDDVSHQLSVTPIASPVGPTLTDAVPDVPGVSATVEVTPQVAPMVLRSGTALSLDDGVALPDWNSLPPQGTAGSAEHLEDALYLESKRIRQTHDRGAAIDDALVLHESERAEPISALSADAGVWGILTDSGPFANVSGLEAAARHWKETWATILANAASATESHPLLALTQKGALPDAGQSKGIADAPSVEMTVPPATPTASRPLGIKAAVGFAVSGILLLRPTSLLPGYFARRRRHVSRESADL